MAAFAHVVINGPLRRRGAWTRHPGGHGRDDGVDHRLPRFTRGYDGLLGGAPRRSAYELSTFM
jgi:hypothetical protein